MSARDDLALEIAGYPVGPQSLVVGLPTAREIAAGILAAGYRKTRTITDVEELDALGTNAAVLAADGAVWVNDGDCTEPWACVTEDPQGGPVWADDDGIQLPAIVLHEP